MTRRRLVALVSVAVLVALGLLVFATGLFVLHTGTGRAKLRSAVVPFVQSKLPNARIYIGNISGSFIGDLTIDSVAIRDLRGDLFLSTGRISLAYNWRDIIDYRLYFRTVSVEHPFVHIVQHETGNWNFKEIFASKNQGPEKPKDPNARNLGDYIVLDSTTARNTTFLLTMPWHPDPGLRRVQRDSVIRFHLTHAEKDVAKTFDGYGRTYAWRNGSGLLSHVRLADPDSDKFGKEFNIAALRVDELDPTFQFRNVRGQAILRGDTLLMKIPHFDMPASTGHADGRVWWGSDLPVRYAITVHGDSVSLNDVNWVYPTLPRTGGGTLDLLIRNDPKNLQVVDFQLHRMDVRSTGSHLVGDMWFGTGAPLLLVRNVDLRADPVDFELLKTLAGKPFPEDWRGQIFGTVKARGGPLTNFFVDDARGRFEDAHVRGAVSEFTGRGELNILVPALTEFHHFDVNAEKLDLRTIEYLFPSFPKLNGYVAGTAVLDSSWLDVRFADAHLIHQDGPGDPTRASGSGRITYGTLMTYDLALDAQPLNLSMLARSPQFAGIPMGGLWNGPIRARGTAPDLELSAALQGAHGALSFDGRVDLDTVGGLGAHGRGQFSALDVAALMDKPTLPKVILSGHYDVDLVGEHASDLAGSVDVTFDPTTIDSVRVYGSRARLRFADGRMAVDSMHVRTSAFTADANGGLGLPKGRPDSLHFTIQVDSLGGLRPLFPAPDTTLLGAAATPPDSLSGVLTLNGVASGTFDALDLHGRVAGNDLYRNREKADAFSATFDLRDVLNRRTGEIRARADSVALLGVALDTVGFMWNFADSAHARFSLAALSATGPTIGAAGNWSKQHATQLVALDSLGFSIDTDRWALARPARLAFDSTSIRIDSLLLRNRDSASITMNALLPDRGPAFANVRALSVPLADVSTLFQLPDTLHGVGQLAIVASGTTAQPRIDLSANLASVRWAGVSIDQVSTTARYADRRLNATASVIRDRKQIVDASANVPVEVTLPMTVKRLNDTLSAQLRVDTTDLSLIKTLLPRTALDSVRGTLFATVEAHGTQRNPIVSANVGVRDGGARVPALGIGFNSIVADLTGGADVGAKRDSIVIAVYARTSQHDRVTLNGIVRNLGQPNGDPALSFRLAMDSLHALKNRSLADLYLSTPKDTLRQIRLFGTLKEPVITGTINVDRGSIFLADPDVANKLSVTNLASALGDSAGNALTFGTSSFARTILTNLVVRDATVTLGQDVRLRSKQADVRLTGTLDIAKAATSTHLVATNGQFVPGLTLNGVVTTVGGTFNLDLGLVQREFTVLPEGTVMFDGGSPETPLVDIKAQYRVPRYHDRDLTVIVNYQGRMPNPKISFASDADYELSQSDILSYLVIGKPGFDFGANAQAAQVLASVLSPTLSSLANDRLRQSLPGLDAIRFQLGTTNDADTQTGFFSSRNLSNYLYSSSVAAEWQVSSKMFVGVSTGFCQISTGPLNSVGAQVGYRFDPKMSLQLSYDPPSQTRTCGQSALIGLAPPPGQFGISLNHTWRF